MTSMRAAHLPADLSGNAPQYRFPNKTAGPEDLHVTYGLYLLPRLNENSKDAICYKLRVDTTAFTRGELTWPETLQAERFHVYGGPVPGHDVVGTVEAIHHGPFKAPRFKPGDRVWGLLNFDRDGAAAEYAMALEDELALAPSYQEGVSVAEWNQELATVPLSGLTAFQALFTYASLSVLALNPSETADRTKSILVTGASGSVGVFVVQLAKAAGLHVIALCGTKGMAFVERELKPDVTIDYTAADFLDVSTEVSKRKIAAIDVVIDCIGGAILKDLLLNGDWIKPSGKVISVAGPLSDYGSATAQKLEQSCTRRQLDFTFFIVKPNSEQLSILSHLFSEKRIKGYVDAVFPLEEARQAMQRVEKKGTKKGKVVVEIHSKDASRSHNCSFIT
jgi:NADPH:quinone reductase-like Zn-dependent oxidoreductase